MTLLFGPHWNSCRDPGIIKTAALTSPIDIQTRFQLMKRIRRNNRQSSHSCPFRVSERIRPIAMFDCHDYRRGESYEVVNIDTNDSTLQARDEHGQLGRWIRWRDCEKFDDIGWEWLKGQLSADALEILSAFEGLNNLTLRPELRVALIQQVPGLKDKVLDACVAFETKSNNS
jgi:hypothetical protein